MSNASVLKFEKVCFAYEEPHAPTIVKDVSFDLAPGTFTSIVGPSGGGKSTLLRLSVGLKKPVRGAVTNTARTRMIFQDAALLPWRTVKENVELGFTGLKTSKHEQARRVHEELANLGLTDFADKHPRDLSGGQRQRVGIARALVSDPELLLLDEPFASLDVETTERLCEELLAIFAQRNITMFMVSHSIEDAVYLSDAVFVFSGGVISHKVPVLFPRPRHRDDVPFEKLVKEIKGFIPTT